MPGFDVILTGDPEQLRGAVIKALEAQQFRLTWRDHWHALAEKGTKLGPGIGGLFSEHYAVEVEITSGGAGQSVVAVVQRSAAWKGSVFAAPRLQRSYAALRDRFASWFQQQGQLVRLQERS